MMTSSEGPARRCPGWCGLRHARFEGEEDLVHVSEEQFVRDTIVRLCMTIEDETGRQDGPYLLLGDDEYTLEEAAALVDVLRALLQQGRSPSPRAGS